MLKTYVVAIAALFTAVGCGNPVSVAVQTPRAGLVTQQQPDGGAGDFSETALTPLSTFSVDVDTGSYTLARRALLEGELPNPETVRTEEFLNFFSYTYPQPKSDEAFSVSLGGAPSPFGAGLHLLRIGLQGRTVNESERKPANLVFLIDVSGSMQSVDKLPLVQFALKELVRRLSPDDTIGIVTYAGSDRVALEPTPVSERGKILEVIEELGASGSTAGEAGIRAAYALAEKAKREGGINRVILCTDGDFNVGLRDGALIKLIEDFRNKGINLTTLGFGSGNYKDAQLEQLADHGNGNYAYIDGEGEAVRALGEKLVSTLQVIAKDVKIQVEFNPLAVKRYRLIGYDNRRLAAADFADDTKDAGEIGAGHSVTALYEVELVGESTDALGLIRLRAKKPEGDVSEESTHPIDRGVLVATLDEASSDLRFATAVTEFAEILGTKTTSQGARFEDVVRLARANASDVPARLEFVELVRAAQVLWKSR
jgi:Ca-activated chloride channel family protein